MAIEFVQFDDFFDNASDTTISNNTTLNTTTGNLLVVVVSGRESGVVSGVTDTEGNTYQRAIEFSSFSMVTEIWYAENITGNANNTTTVTFTVANTQRYISVSEFSGVATSSSLLDTSQQETNSNAHSSGTATSINTGDLIIGGCKINGSRNMTLGTDFSTLSSDLTSVFDLAEYDILGVAGNYDADFTHDGSARTALVNCAIFSSVEVTTGTNMQINIGDTWKEVPSIQINIGDVWKEVVSLKLNIGDVWKEVF